MNIYPYILYQNFDRFFFHIYSQAFDFELCFEYVR